MVFDNYLLKTMSYAKKTSAKPPTKREESFQHQTGNRSQEQQKLLRFIEDLRTRQTRPYQAHENKNHGPRQPPKESRKPVIPFGLSKKLSQLKISETEETAKEKRERLKRTLSRFDSPFIWRPVFKKFSHHEKQSVLVKLQEKDDEIVDEKEFKWRNFILKLVISYELFLAERVSEAMEVVCELEEMLIKNSNNVEWLFLGIKDALWHVVSTSKAFLYLEQNNLEEAERIIDCVQPVRTMRRAGRAGIHGIRAAVFMEYGHEGNLKALPEAKKASELDTKSAEWHFLVGKCMGRIRRVAHCHDPVDELEITSMNKAVKNDENNPLYKVYLAQTIRERAFRKYKKEYPESRSQERIKLERGFKASCHLYREAKEMRPNCPHILVRCAYGTMKQPIQYVDLKFVRECLDKAIELAPNNMMAHHIKGLYHERFNTEVEAAMEEIEIAASLGNFGAALDLVRMRYRLKKGDPVQELAEVASTYAEPSYIQVALTQAGSYMLFIKFDLVGAVKYFTKVVSMDMNSYAMKSHKSMFLRMKDPVNLFHVLLAELDEHTEWMSFSQEDKMVLKKFRISILEHDTLENKENRLTVAELLDMSRNQENIDSNKRENLKKKKKKSRGVFRWLGLKRKGKSKQKSKNEKKMCIENKDSTFKLKEWDGICDAEPLKEEISSAKAMQRSRSVTSISSVDSDYERDSILHGSRGFFVNSESSASNEPVSMGESNTSNTIGQFYEDYTRFRSFQSRHYSTSSMSSEDELSGQLHNSRYQSQMCISNKPEENLSKICSNIENLKLSNSASSEYFKTRRTSVSSIESDTGTEKLSVMDRVKQSYAMLNRMSNPNKQSEKKNLRRSESVQSMNKQHKKKTDTVQRSDSTQSLNVEVDSLKTTLERFKPFESRASSVSSSHSYSFMPNFAKK